MKRYEQKVLIEKNIRLPSQIDIGGQHHPSESFVRSCVGWRGMERFLYLLANPLLDE